MSQALKREILKPDTCNLKPCCEEGPGLPHSTLDVGADAFVVCDPPVSLGHGEDLLHVPVCVVVGVQRSVPVLRRPTVLEVAGGRGYGVFGVHYVGDPIAVAVHARGLPCRWHELHRAHRAGAGRSHGLAVVGLYLPYGREYVPVGPEPVVRGRRLVEFHVSFLGGRLDRSGYYVFARDLELMLATHLSPAGSRRALLNARPLRRFEILQTGFRPCVVGAQAVYGSVERLLALAKVSGRRLLLLDGSIVVAPLLRDLTLRVPERLPRLSIGCQIQSTIQKDAGHHRVIGPCDALPGIEEPPVQQGGQAFETFTLVGGLSLCPVPGLRLAEGRIPLGYLSFQLPGLPPEILDARHRVIRPRLRPVQLCAYGGDLLDHAPQCGVLITYLVFQQWHPRGPHHRRTLALILRPRRPLSTRQDKRNRYYAQYRPNSYLSSRHAVPSP